MPSKPVHTNTFEARQKAWDIGRAGTDMYALIETLYPICRSITGDGNRKTLSVLGEHIDLRVHEVDSGAPVFDWVVPPEWNIRDAWIKDPDGRKIVDFRNHNLHVLGYSRPVHQTLSLEDLKPHLHSLPEHPDWIPYRTSYYRETWGFCVTDRLKNALKPGSYEVWIDADLQPGRLTYGETVLPGATDEEFLFSTHICHPSLANDNLSGIALAVQLARLLKPAERRYTYRFLFIPGTIGSITWLARNTETARRIRHGLVLSCVGDTGFPHYKRSRRGNAPIDRALAHALKHGAPRHEITDFSPYGYDERQYGSPGFDLPVGLFTRSPHGAFPEYHTSADNLDLVRPEALADSLRLVLDAIAILEGDGRYRNTNPMCEPQLGRRGLYDTLGGASDRKERQLALLWVLNQSDGAHTLLDIAERSEQPFARIREAADRLLENDLLVAEEART